MTTAPLDPHRKVSPEPTIAWMKHLNTQAGMTRTDVARVAGLPPTTLYCMQKRQTILAYTETAVLGVRLPFTRIGIRRRLRALTADGFPTPYIAETTGMSQARVVALRSGRDLCTYDKGVSILAVYEDCLGKRPPVDEARYENITQRAERLGYVPSYLWEPGRIDDPDAVPQYTGACGTLEGYRRHMADEDSPYFMVFNAKGGRVRTHACPACYKAYRARRTRREWERKVLREAGVVRTIGRMTAEETVRVNEVLEAARVRGDDAGPSRSAFAQCGPGEVLG